MCLKYVRCRSRSCTTTSSELLVLHQNLHFLRSPIFPDTRFAGVWVFSTGTVFLVIWECLSIGSSARGAKLLKIRKTPRSQALSPQGPRKGEEEHTYRHTLKAYVKEDRTGGTA